MVLLRYLTPFAFLALLPFGGWLGGAWTFMAAAATPLCLASLDAALGDDQASQPERTTASRWLPRIYILLQLAATAWAATLVAKPTISLFEAAGLVASAGLLTGVFGFVAAHEMIHSRDARERALGLALLASVFYMHFRIAHVYGHHRRAATFDDPATARLGEGLYAFLARSITGQLSEAWSIEAQRARRLGRPVINLHNRMVVCLAVEIALLIAAAAVSVRLAVFLGATALVAVALLESFNYVAHYGLARRRARNGRLERLGPQHSWNSSRRMNNAALFNMGRHSDHHRRPGQAYDQLKPLDAAVNLPSGYAAALLTASIPPLWRRIMDHRATEMATIQPPSKEWLR